MELYLPDIWKLMADKLITVREHPDADLYIANYSPVVQHDKLWNKHPLLPRCRGLIFDGTGHVVARPVPKFFNVGEVDFPDGSFTVSDKADGSLGIIYWIDDIPYVATRGSFESEQAKLGTLLLHTKYRESWPLLDRQRTILCEIVGQSNRIVLHYKEDMLILLIVIDTETGAESEVPEIGFPTVKQHGRFSTLSDFIASLPEGSTRNDFEERIRIPQNGMAILPRMPSSTGTSSLRQAVAELSPSGGRGEEQALYGLSEKLSTVRDGLRPQAGGDKAVRNSGTEQQEQELEGAESGDCEVRRGMLELPPSEDLEEGFVLRWDDGTRLKLKTSEYLRLHKILTGVTARRVWEVMSAGDDLNKWLDKVPDEFAQWVLNEAAHLTVQFKGKLDLAMWCFEDIIHKFEGSAYPDRKQFAAEAIKHEQRDILFAMYDHKKFDHMIWKRIKPAAETPFKKSEEQ